MFNDESTNSRADTPSGSAPKVTRLYNKCGPVDRRELLRAATTGIVGTILSVRSENATSLFSRLMGDFNPLMPAASAAEAEALRIATLGEHRRDARRGAYVSLGDVGSDEPDRFIEPPRVGDVRESLADITQARKWLGYEPAVDFDEGLRRSIDYYRSIVK